MHRLMAQQYTSGMYEHNKNKGFITILLAVIVSVTAIGGAWLYTHEAKDIGGPRVFVPVQGGTGTSTVPASGEVLVGQADGTYAPQATSTLNITADVAITGNEAAFDGWDKDASDDYTSVDFATDLAGTTTDALAEGSSNLYHTVQRVKDILVGGWDSIFGNSTTTNATTTNAYVANLTADDATFTNATTSLITIGNNTFNGEDIAFAFNTGILTGGEVTYVDATHFAIATGTGVIVDSYTDPSDVIFTPVAWNASSSILAENLTSDTYVVYLDANGDIQQKDVSTFNHDGSFRSSIKLGGFSTDGSAIVAMGNEVAVPANLTATLYEFFAAFGNFNMDGNVFYNASNDLQLDKTSGVSFHAGGNFQNSRQNPNIRTSEALTDITFLRQYQDGVGDFVTEFATTTDPDKWDDGDGTLGTVNNNQWTTKRIFWRADSDQVLITYGQTIYNSKSEAISDVLSESPALSTVKDVAIHRANLIVRGGATNLNDTADAVFIEVPKFGGLGGGSSLSTASLQDAYENGTEPEIVTNLIRMAVSIKGGTGDDTDDNIEILNNAGTITGVWKANGTVGIATSTPETALSVVGTTTTSNLDVTGTVSILGQIWATITDFTTYIRGLFSNTATGLTYNSSTGETSLTAGYEIPLTASTTEWDAAYASTTEDRWLLNTGDDATGTYNFNGQTNLSTTTIDYWLSQNGNLGLDLTDNGSDLVLHGNVGGTNSLTLSTDGAFFDLIANPGPSNGYLLAAITETQGSDTQINFYEGGTGHNRFWDSGSARFGGGEGYLCSTLTSAVDCDTSGTGADIVVQDDIWFGGSIISTSTEDSSIDHLVTANATSTNMYATNMTWANLLSTVDISSNTNLVAGTNITLSGDTLNVDDAFLLNTGDIGNGNYAFNGNVAIGTTTIDADLSVKVDGERADIDFETASAHDVRIELNSGTSATTTSGIFQMAYNSSLQWGTLTNHPIYTYINNSFKMSLDTDGQLGLGTANAQEDIEVEDSTGATMALYAGSGQLAGIKMSERTDGEFGIGIFHDGADNQMEIWDLTTAGALNSLRYRMTRDGKAGYLTGGLYFDTNGNSWTTTTGGDIGTVESSILVLSNAHTMTDGYSYSHLFTGGDTYTTGTTGTHPVVADIILTAPVINAGTATVATGTTLYIEGAPTGTATIGNTSALYVNGDNSIFMGNVGIGTTTPDTTLSVVDSAATTTVSIGDVGSIGCIRMRDSDDAGWSYGTILNGTMSWSTTPCE